MWRFLGKVYTVNEAAAELRISRDSVIRMFANYPEVLVLPSANRTAKIADGTLGKIPKSERTGKRMRRYRHLRIPEVVLKRALAEFCNAA